MADLDAQLAALRSRNEQKLREVALPEDPLEALRARNAQKVRDVEDPLVKVRDIDGTQREVRTSQTEALLDDGWSLVTAEDQRRDQLQAEYGDTKGEAVATAASVLRGVTFGLSDVIAKVGAGVGGAIGKALSPLPNDPPGVDFYDDDAAQQMGATIQSYIDANPRLSLSGEIVSGVAAAALTGGASVLARGAGAVAKAGTAAATAARLAELTPVGQLTRFGTKAYTAASSTAGRIAAVGAEAAVDSAVRQVSQDIVEGKTKLTAERMSAAALSAARAGLVGFALGGTVGAIGETFRRAYPSRILGTTAEDDELRAILNERFPEGRPTPEGMQAWDDLQREAASLDEFAPLLRPTPRTPNYLVSEFQGLPRGNTLVEDAMSLAPDEAKDLAAKLSKPVGSGGNPETDAILEALRHEDLQALGNKYTERLNVVPETRIQQDLTVDPIIKEGQGFIKQTIEKIKNARNIPKLEAQLKGNTDSLAKEVRDAWYQWSKEWNGYLKPVTDDQGLMYHDLMVQAKQRLGSSPTFTPSQITNLRREGAELSNILEKTKDALPKADVQRAVDLIEASDARLTSYLKNQQKAASDMTIPEVFSVRNELYDLLGRLAKGHGETKTAEEASLRLAYLRLGNNQLNDQLWPVELVRHRLVTRQAETRAKAASRVLMHRFGKPKAASEEVSLRLRDSYVLPELDGNKLRKALSSAADPLHQEAVVDLVRGMRRQVELARIRGYYDPNIRRSPKLAEPIQKMEQNLNDFVGKINDLRRSQRQLEVTRALVRDNQDIISLANGVVNGASTLGLIGGLAWQTAKMAGKIGQSLGPGAIALIKHSVKEERAQSKAVNAVIDYVINPVGLNRAPVMAISASVAAKTLDLSERLLDPTSEERRTHEAQIELLARESGPALAQEVDQQVMRTAEFLQAKRGPTSYDTPLGPREIARTAYQEEEIRRYVEAAYRPALAFARGSAQDIETLRTLYPERFKRFQQLVLERIRKDKLQLDVRQRADLKRRTGVDLDQVRKDLVTQQRERQASPSSAAPPSAKAGARRPLDPDQLMATSDRITGAYDD